MCYRNFPRLHAAGTVKSTTCTGVQITAGRQYTRVVKRAKRYYLALFRGQFR
jgi:hypothetical protein